MISRATRFLNGIEDLTAAFFRDGRVGEDPRAWKFLLKIFRETGAFLLRELVHLICNDEEGDVIFFQMHEHLDVQCGWSVAPVDDDNCELETSGIGEVVKDQMLELITFPGRDFCKAIPRKIDKIKQIVDLEEIYQLRATRCRARAAQILFARQGIDERGFSYI